MGKVTIIIQATDCSTTEIYKDIMSKLAGQPAHDLFPDYEVYVVPADEEYPDL